MYRVFKDFIIVVIMHVDDLLTAGNDQRHLDAFVSEFSKMMKLNVVGTISQNGDQCEFLGLEIRKSPMGIHLSCSNYSKKYLQSRNIDKANFIRSPCNGDTVNDGVDLLADVGVMLYASQACRPDLSYATSHLSRFSSVNNLKRIQRYLCGTQNDGISFTNRSAVFSASEKIPISILTFTEDFANDPVTLKSISVCASFLRFGVFIISTCGRRVFKSLILFQPLILKLNHFLVEQY
eukprot:TRINITY_DN818_c0_g1_i4.p1 TRINITY_DN818_c0_g1~~TRINITY_DN818_c0_g1_i4.p1  ORF type:complete len:236 (-),score=52.02 TRINITY_DN818_c0_g1_i4:2461-3168(-)